MQRIKKGCGRLKNEGKNSEILENGASKTPDLAVVDAGGSALLRVRVQPRASRENASLSVDGRLRIAVTAPPVDDAANKALCVFLSKMLNVARRDVTVTAGKQSKNKTVRIAKLSAGEAAGIIRQYLRIS